MKGEDRLWRKVRRTRNGTCAASTDDVIILKNMYEVLGLDENVSSTEHKSGHAVEGNRGRDRESALGQKGRIEPGGGVTNCSTEVERNGGDKLLGNVHISLGPPAEGSRSSAEHGIERNRVSARGGESARVNIDPQRREGMCVERVRCAQTRECGGFYSDRKYKRSIINAGFETTEKTGVENIIHDRNAWEGEKTENTCGMGTNNVRNSDKGHKILGKSSSENRDKAEHGVEQCGTSLHASECVGGDIDQWGLWRCEDGSNAIAESANTREEATNNVRNFDNGHTSPGDNAGENRDKAELGVEQCGASLHARNECAVGDIDQQWGVWRCEDSFAESVNTREEVQQEDRDTIEWVRTKGVTSSINNWNITCANEYTNETKVGMNTHAQKEVNTTGATHAEFSISGVAVSNEVQNQTCSKPTGYSTSTPRKIRVRKRVSFTRETGSRSKDNGVPRENEGSVRRRGKIREGENRDKAEHRIEQCGTSVHASERMGGDIDQKWGIGRRVEENSFADGNTREEATNNIRNPDNGHINFDKSAGENLDRAELWVEQWGTSLHTRNECDGGDIGQKGGGMAV